MNEFKFYRDKQEKVSCFISVEGTTLNNSRIRLLLESKNGLNYYFNGKIDNTGKCIINIPALKKLEENETGNAIIEAIIDDSYFKLLEQPFSIKNSISIKFNQEDEKIEENIKPTIKFNLEEEEINESKIEKVEKPKENKSKKLSIISFEEFKKRKLK